MTRSGGCLCGGVRYDAAGDPLWVAHCHCTSCRKASGAPMVTWAGYKPSAVEWTKTDPKDFSSSEGVLRRFCPNCGTPLTYESTRWPDELHILVATLDDPESLTPKGHVYWSEHLAWLEIGDDLPKFAETGASVKKDN
ncbi:MAG: GFA family protein [Alphaproteobacteria bacterium]|nr:GFA family protein [Alphaproteobacteria bacterium]